MCCWPAAWAPPSTRCSTWSAWSMTSNCFPTRCFPAMLEWWVPNALAALVVTPVIITWGHSVVGAAEFLAEPARPALCAAGLVCGTLISFDTWFVYGIQQYPLAYLPYPFLAWSALRFGPRGRGHGHAAGGGAGDLFAVAKARAVRDRQRGRQPAVGRQLHRHCGRFQPAAGQPPPRNAAARWPRWWPMKNVCAR